MRKLHIAGCLFVGATTLILFGPSSNDGARGANVPNWFRDLDADGDGQVALEEWLAGGRGRAEFEKHDLNRDGHITPEEAVRGGAGGGATLELVGGRASFSGNIEMSSGEAYRGRRAYRAFSVRLQGGRTYQIEQVSPVYFAYLFLEGPDGRLLAHHDSGGEGLAARIVHRAERTGAYRVIASSQGGFRTGPCTVTVRALEGGAPAPAVGLPKWFRDLDADGDGQVALPEWLAVGRGVGEFDKYDVNRDGLISPEEAVRGGAGAGSRLELVGGRASFSGDVEMSAGEPYRGRRAYRAFSVRLQGGKTYQIEQVSPVYFAYLFLEGPDGRLLAQHDSGGNGRIARIVHRAERTGAYRVIASSQGGFRTGPCTVTVRALPGLGGANLPRGVPGWFRDLDADGDGQVALEEWLAGGRGRGEFQKYDQNQDGHITPEEAMRGGYGSRLELVGGRASFSGDVEMSPGEAYRGKRAFRAFSVRLERGKSYQIEQVSPVYYAYLYLEGPDGRLLAQHDSGGNGKVARIVHRAARTGTYRVIATSLGGFRTGACTLTVRALAGLGGGGAAAVVPKGVPNWFRKLDTDGDGQVSLAEWLEAKWDPDEFQHYDRNEDGLITPEEVLRVE